MPGDSAVRARPEGVGTVPVATIVIGALLVALGLWGRLGTEHGAQSVTSLIPAFVGAPLAVLGLLALKESFLKHAMHLAAVIGLLGLLGAAGNLVRELLRGTAITSPSALSTLLMTLLCAVFVALCVGSFRAARRRRRAREVPARS
jgi:hypothetical protein